MEYYAYKQVAAIAGRLLLIFFILATCIVFPGCKDATRTGGNDSAIIWSAESQSPDNHYMASARTEQSAGFGTAGVKTTVCLKQRGQQEAAEILILSNEAVSPHGITAVDLTWVTPSHLNISFKSHADIYYQVVKCAGVEISVEKKGE